MPLGEAMTAHFWTPDRLDDAWYALADGAKTETVAESLGVSVRALTSALRKYGCSIYTARVHWRKKRLNTVLRMRSEGMTYCEIGEAIHCQEADAWRIANGRTDMARERVVVEEGR